MSVQATKLRLMQLILENNNPALLDSLVDLLSSGKAPQKIIQLTPEEEALIDEGIDDLDNGRTITYDEFIRKFG